MKNTAPLRVAVVTGLHRAARKETVESLLAAVPRSIAVHHGFENVDDGVVHRSTRDRWGTRDRRTIELVHVCASCALREDLLPFLLRLAAENEHELCVVEGWDSVEPHAIAEAIATETPLDLSAVITAVDAEHLLGDLETQDDLQRRGLDIAQDDDRSVAEVLARQIEHPGTLVLHGTRYRRTALSLLEQLNPDAAALAPDDPIAEATRGTFDPKAAAERVNPAWAHYTPLSSGRVSTFTWTRKRPLHPERLHNALADIVAGCLRGRGRIWLASQPDTVLVWDSHAELLVVEGSGPWLAALPPAAMDLVSPVRRASARLDWDPLLGDRRQHLAFTGLDLDTERLETLLDSCLLTEEEDGQVFQEDPFADML